MSTTSVNLLGDYSGGVANLVDSEPLLAVSIVRSV